MAPRSKYSHGFKIQIIKDILDGNGVTDVATVYGLPYSTVNTWFLRRSEILIRTENVAVKAEPGVSVDPSRNIPNGQVRSVGRSRKRGVPPLIISLPGKEATLRAKAVKKIKAAAVKRQVKKTRDNLIRMRTEMEEQLLKWCKEQADEQVILSFDTVMIKAEQLIDYLNINAKDFNCNSGWLQRFRDRYGLTFYDESPKKIIKTEPPMSNHIETEHIPAKSISYMEKLIQADCELNDINSNKNDEELLPGITDRYGPSDIYNIVEIGMLYDLHPNKIMSYSDNDYRADQFSDHRLTVMMCANMSGSDKRKLLVVGKLPKNNFYSGINCCPVNYESSCRSWMNSAIFENWLRAFDNCVQQEKRQVALILDSSPAHPTIYGLQAIELFFLPTSESEKFQPLEKGVTRKLRIMYRQQLVEKFLQAMGDNVAYIPTKLEAIHMIHSAWNSVEPSRIQRSFLLSKFRFPPEESHTLSECSEHLEEIPNEFQQVFQMLKRIGLVSDVSVEDFIDFDSNVSVCATIAEEDMIDIQQSYSNLSEEVHDATLLRTVKYSEALKMLYQVRTFVQSTHTDNEEILFSSIANVENYILKSGTQSYTV